HLKEWVMNRRTIFVMSAFLGLLSWRGMGVIKPSPAGQSQLPDDSRGWSQVDCDTEHSGALQRAIDRASPGRTIRVTGTCHENVSIPAGKDLLTLDGGGHATISGPDATLNTILVRGPRGITITGLTITGGRVGIDVSRGSSALIDGNTIEGTG